MTKSAPQNNGHLVSPPVTKPTSAAEWRRLRQEGYTITLPSGNVATLRPVPLDKLIQKGEIPDYLTPVAARSLWIESESDKIAEDGDLNKKFIELINYIVPLAVIIPAIVENPEDGKEEITIDDVDFMDKVAIFNLAIQPSSVLRSFRDQQEERMASVRDGEDDELETEQSS